MNAGPLAEATIMNEDSLIGRLQETVRLDDPETGGLSTWFPGPIGENEELLQRLVALVVRDHSVGRRIAYPDDPPWIDTTTPGHQRASEQLETQIHILMRRLSRFSIPWFSYRYHAHMTWDTSLPALIGYLGGMLYNQNNVAGEGGPVTTALEIEAAQDLCRMIGYGERKENGLAEDEAEAKKMPKPWGHITSGGSVANTEALWAARNLKLYPAAVSMAIKVNDLPYRGFSVTLATGESKPIAELSAWEVLNIPAEHALSIPRRLQKETGWPDEVLQKIDEYSVQSLGLGRFTRLFGERFDVSGQMVDWLAFVAPASCHYSLMKAVSLLGLGFENLVRLEIDGDARMRIDHLRSTLEQRLKDQRPVAAVIVVIGSTQEGAVDQLDKVLEVREEFRRQGLDFAIHADAAWGGYFCSLLHKERDKLFEPSIAISGLGSDKRSRDFAIGKAVAEKAIEDLGAGAVAGLPAYEAMPFEPEMVLSEYTARQLKCLREVDSVTLDPHKAGFAPYPAGALCYRDHAMAEMVSYRAPVVFHDEETPSVGIYGLEGSKPGAAAAGVWLSHRHIPPDRRGYGKILGRAIFGAKRLIGAIAAMESSEFVIAPLQRLEKDEIIKLQAMRDCTNKELFEKFVKHPEFAALFREFGSDLVVNAYAVNLKMPDGKKVDAAVANDFNRRVYKRLSLDVEGDEWPPIIITGAEYDPKVVGPAFVNDFRERLGIDTSDLPMHYLISTSANPFLTDAEGGGTNLVPRIVKGMQIVIEKIAVELKEELAHRRPPQSWG